MKTKYTGRKEIEADDNGRGESGRARLFLSGTSLQSRHVSILKSLYVHQRILQFPYNTVTMALTRLPIEIVDIIIRRTIPEGFQSLALTCKELHVLCTPFIEHHNKLCSQFTSFRYFQWSDGPAHQIWTAFDLITRIAVEPVVAHYVREAYFKMDSLYTKGRPRELLADVNCGGAVVKLLASSPYLEQAGLNWKEYYDEIETDLQALRYSQHAAAFLLTLLPNINKLTLPKRWKPLEATDKLIDAVVRKVKYSYLSYDKPPLAQTAKLEFSVPRESRGRSDLIWASPFLALPHVRSFYGPNCVAMGDDAHNSFVSMNLNRDFGEILETVHLVGCCIDEVGIADFLANTTHLKTLEYSHTTAWRGGNQDWDICKFVSAIARQVGNHLEELSISIRSFRGSIVPGEVTMRSFQRLRKLEFPLIIAKCNIDAAATQIAALNHFTVGGSTDLTLDCAEILISDLVPPSVSQLSLISSKIDRHDKAIELIFRHFAAKKAFLLPALHEIHLSCPAGAADAYKDQCARLVEKCERAGVLLHLGISLSPVTFT